MSRDFVVDCADADEAIAAEKRLLSIVSASGRPLFEVDNRGKDLFVMLTWPDDIGEDFVYRVGNASYRDFRNDVSFVAIKNGQHNGVGYLIDTGRPAESRPTIPLAEMPARICEALGTSWQAA